jgi:hypothetical protein
MTQGEGKMQQSFQDNLDFYRLVVKAIPDPLLLPPSHKSLHPGRERNILCLLSLLDETN